MGAGYKGDSKSSPALKDPGKEKVRQDLHPQSQAQYHCKVQTATSTERSHPIQRNQESFILNRSERWGNDWQSPTGHLFDDLVSRSNHKPEILFHLPSWDWCLFPTLSSLEKQVSIKATYYYYPQEESQEQGSEIPTPSSERSPSMHRKELRPRVSPANPQSSGGKAFNWIALIWVGLGKFVTWESSDQFTTESHTAMSQRVSAAVTKLHERWHCLLKALIFFQSPALFRLASSRPS